MTRKHSACLSTHGRGSPSTTKAAGSAAKKFVAMAPSIHGVLAARQGGFEVTGSRRTTMSPHLTTPSTRHWVRHASPATGLNDAGSRGGPSTAVAMAVALIATVVVAVILALTFWLLRLRRRSRSAADVKGHGSPVTLPDSPTPLVSVAGSQVSPDKLLRIPPPRLQERRLLPQKASRSPHRDTGRRQSPKRPDASPPATGPAPLSDKTPPAPAGGEEPPPPSARPDTPSLTGRRTPAAAPSTAVSNSMPDPAVSTASTPSGASAAVSARPDGGTPAFPRTPRQAYKPFSLVGLACPGPPPNRALPPTPRDKPRSAPAAPTRQQGEATPARHPVASVALSPPADWSREPGGQTTEEPARPSQRHENSYSRPAAFP